MKAKLGHLRIGKHFEEEEKRSKTVVVWYRHGRPLITSRRKFSPSRKELGDRRGPVTKTNKGRSPRHLRVFDSVSIKTSTSRSSLFSLILIAYKPTSGSRDE